MGFGSWIIRPTERKQILLIKIPIEEVKKYSIKDGQIPKVTIKSRNQTLYQGPLRVTSGHELYLPKHVRETIEKERELHFKIMSSGVRG